MNKTGSYPIVQIIYKMLNFKQINDKKHKITQN